MKHPMKHRVEKFGNVSAVLIVRNAAETLGKCLASLSSFAEVLVYDSGSTDSTKEIALSYTNVRWKAGPFIGFGPTKQKAVLCAHNDWIFSIDADEEVSPTLSASVAAFDLSNSARLGKISRHNFFLGKEIRVGGWGRNEIVRLFHRGMYHFSDDAVHEQVIPIKKTNTQTKNHTKTKTIIALDGALSHYTITRLGQTLEKANLYAELYAQQRADRRALPLLVIILRAQFSFLRSFLLQFGWLAGWRGFAIALSQAIGVFYKYMKIYANRAQEKEKSL